MEFRLHYRGPLKANGSPAAKHALRKHFHRQLAELWNQLPLTDHNELRSLANLPGNIYLAEKKHGFVFVPLVSERIHLAAHLRILFLRPETPGRVVSGGGDLDNRMKTLLDALKVPHEPTALPMDAVPAEDETPFYTLLQDDALVTGLEVTTDRLLEPVSERGEVLVVVHVTTQITRAILGNIGL